MICEIRAPRGFGAVAVAVLLAGIVVSPPAFGESAIVCDASSGTPWPCNYQIEAVGIQKVPAVFKFQSRVSQAKLPIGEASFNSVIVKLLRGADTLCMEQFADVAVRGSVLNLEIGRNMSCELGEVIAENADLAFQICLGGSSNCLKPLALGASPYAVKASYAHQAENAFRANKAGQASYAHRVTADREMLLRDAVATGYFDFYSSPASTLYDLEKYVSAGVNYDPHDGFVQWAPVADKAGARGVHITGKDFQNERLFELDRFVVASNSLFFGGATHVLTGGVHVLGDSDITGETHTIRGRLLLGHEPTVGDTAGAHYIDGMLHISDATYVDANGIHVSGSSEITGEDLRFTGDTVIVGRTRLGYGPEAADLKGLPDSAHVVDGTLRVTEHAVIGDEMVGVTALGDSDVVGNLDVTGTGSFGSHLHVDADGADITGFTSITGDVDIGVGHVLSIAGVTAVGSNGLGTLQLNQGGAHDRVELGAAALDFAALGGGQNAGTVFHGSVVDFRDGVNVDNGATVQGGMAVTGLATFNDNVGVTDGGVVTLAGVGALGTDAQGTMTLNPAKRTL